MLKKSCFVILLVLAACDPDALTQVDGPMGGDDLENMMMPPDVPRDVSPTLPPAVDGIVDVRYQPKGTGVVETVEIFEPVDPNEELGCATPTSVYATLNPADAQQNITLSGNNLTAKTTTTNDTVRATQGKRYGRWYFEVLVVNSGGSFNAIGVTAGTSHLELGLGDHDFGCGYQSSGSLECAFGTYREWNVAPAYAAGTIVQVAVDLDRRRIYFGRDGSWLFGQDPASLTDGYDLGYDPDCGAIYPAVNISEMDLFTANFGATPFTYPVPVGYEPGWFEDATCPEDHCGSVSVAPTSCTLVTDPRQITAAYPPSTPIAGACSGGYPLSNYTNTLLASCYAQEVHVIGVYEGTMQRVEVQVQPSPLPIVLVLNSYDSVSWTLNVDPAAQLDRVIVHGYEPQGLSGAPATTLVEVLPQSGPIDAYSYGWEVSANGGGGSYYQLISDVRSYTQMMELSFQGCYSGASFTVPW